jgi:hypothetical protein
MVSPIFLPHALGGNPNPNSSTFTPKNFAVRKCPSSCTKTKTVRTRRKEIIVRSIGSIILQIM